MQSDANQYLLTSCSRHFNFNSSTAGVHGPLQWMDSHHCGPYCVVALVLEIETFILPPCPLLAALRTIPVTCLFLPDCFLVHVSYIGDRSGVGHRYL